MKTRCRGLAGLACACLLVEVPAQAIELRIGLKVGASWSEIMGNEECEQLLVQNRPYHFGLSAGVAFDLEMNGRFVISPEIYVAHKGAEVLGSDLFLTYVELPVLFWYWFPDKSRRTDQLRAGMCAGPAVAYNVFFELDGGHFDDAEDVDVCILLGCALEADHIRFELRYAAGLLDVDPTSSDFVNRTMSIFVGWYF